MQKGCSNFFKNFKSRCFRSCFLPSPVSHLQSELQCTVFYIFVLWHIVGDIIKKGLGSQVIYLSPKGPRFSINSFCIGYCTVHEEIQRWWALFVMLYSVIARSKNRNKLYTAFNLHTEIVQKIERTKNRDYAPSDKLSVLFDRYSLWVIYTVYTV